MKNLMNLGKILNKKEEKAINGGRTELCNCDCGESSQFYCGLYGTLAQCCN